MSAPQQTPQQARLAQFGQFTAKVVNPPPPLPEDVKRRFPSLVKWEQEHRRWAVEVLGVVIQSASPSG